MNIGQIVQKCRWEKGMTQMELSIKSGIPRGTISSVENNRRGTSVGVLEELLETMGYELAVIERSDNG